MATQSIATQIRKQAYELVLWQIAGVLFIALASFALSGLTSAYSILGGGLSYCLANLLFVWAVFRYGKPNEMVQFLTAFLAGEVFKLIVSAILFLIIVKYLPVSLLSVLVGFISAIVMFWIACIAKFCRQPK